MFRSVPLAGLVLVFGCQRARPVVVLPAPVSTVATAPSQRPGPSRIPDREPVDSSPARNSGGERPGAAGNPASTASGPKSYAQVVPKSAITRRGLFITHHADTKILFEIPRSALNTDMLLVGRYTMAAQKQTQAYAGDEFNQQTLRWERRGHQILLRQPAFSVLADSTQTIAAAVRSADVAPIVQSFDVLAYGPDSAAVIDVTAWYMGNAPGKAEPKRSFIERVVAFPDNVEVEATLTVARAAGNNSENAGASSMTAVVHWSMIQLPKQPMRPRLADARIGHFTAGFIDFGTGRERAVTKRYIKRWRLEKKDPSAAISEPVTPIVYYIDPATPDQWKPYVRQAIESWQPAFEAAGFKRAIIARDVPTNDPEWSMEDIRHTVIRWLPSTTENAQGPHVADPRTGEILNGSIRMFHNIVNLSRTWYFTQVGALDPRAQQWPLPDSLMGRLIGYVVAHELGHTLGFPHNHKASSMYPLDSLRSRTWVARMGHTPSLMDYSRYNYVAQPEDRIPVEDLIPQVGPYDIFATHWSYAPIPGTTTPGDELPTLDAWARQQDTVPWYRFGSGSEGSEPGGDPDFGSTSEAVGDADAVRATELGIKNLKRLMPLLSKVAVEKGKNYDALREIHGRVISQWSTEMGHVVQIIGAMETQTRYGGQPGVSYRPLSRDRQAAAIKFLTTQAFTTPLWLIAPDLMQQYTSAGPLARVGEIQGRILSAVLSPGRIQRMLEAQATATRSSDVYAVADLFQDLRRGIWSELKGTSISIDPFRRQLQRLYLKQFLMQLGPPPAPPSTNGTPASGTAASLFVPLSDISALTREELSTLERELSIAIPHATDRETRAHLRDVVQRIQQVLRISTSASKAEDESAERQESEQGGSIVNLFLAEDR